MFFLRQVAASFLLILLAGSSAMACVIPEAQLTPAENKCCQRLHRECGPMPGSADHPCCRTELHPSISYLTVHRANISFDRYSRFQANSADFALMPPPLLENPIHLAEAHSPPGIL